jgi:transcriptional regulator with XRE-family HTH domain
MHLGGFRRDVEPEGVRAFRGRRGWTHEQMADAVGASPLEVAAWEAGTVRVPREQARAIRALVQADHVMAEVVAGGLRPCAWAARNAPDLHDTLLWNPHLRLRTVEEEHVSVCTVCRRMFRYGLDRDARPLPTDPGLGFDDLPRRLWHVLDNTVWGRLILVPGLVVGGVGLLLVAASLLYGLFGLRPGLPDLPDVPAFATTLGWALTYALFGFAVSGSFVHRLRRPYAAGLLRGVAAVAAGALGAAWLGDGVDLLEPDVLAGCALLAVALGLATGAYARWTGGDDAEDDLHPGAPAGATAPASVPLLADAAPRDELDALRARSPGPVHVGP